MKYIYDCADGIKKVNFNRASYKWINYDMPRIYDEDGLIVVEASLTCNGLSIGIYEDSLYKQIEQWILKSDKLFHKHFKDSDWINTLVRLTPEVFN